MKIRLTEGQYKRLLSEDKKGRFITVTPQVIRLMGLINKHYLSSPKKEVIKSLINDMGLTENESLTIWNGWEKDFSSLDIESYRDLLGKELEFRGVYELAMEIPSYLCGRTHLPGFITVEASSEEEAGELMMSGNFLDMEVDQDSQEYRNPDLDYGLEDIDMMEDMSIDRLSDYGIDEIIKDIDLK